MALEPVSPQAASHRGRRDRRGEQRRGELLEAAIRLIGSRGMDAVTHRAVAAEAGVPAASTSYYFRSKGELIDQALRALAEGEIERLRERRAALDAAQLSDPDVIADALAEWIEEQTTPEGSVALLAQYHLQIEAARRPEARDILEDWKTGTDELAEAAMEMLGAPDVQASAILLIAALDGLRLRLLASGHEPLSGADLRDLMRRLLRGLLAE